MIKVLIVMVAAAIAFVPLPLIECYFPETYHRVSLGIFVMGAGMIMAEQTFYKANERKQARVRYLAEAQQEVDEAVNRAKREMVKYLEEISEDVHYGFGQALSGAISNLSEIVNQKFKWTDIDKSESQRLLSIMGKIRDIVDIGANRHLIEDSRAKPNYKEYRKAKAEFYLVEVESTKLIRLLRGKDFRF